jgi:hypothetical protein
VIKLDIEVFSDDSDISIIAEELENGLREEAKVHITEKEISDIVFRGADSIFLLQIINVSLFSIQTVVLLAGLIYQIKKRKMGTTFTIKNPKTGQKVRVSESDSMMKVRKKIFKLLGEIEE